MSSAAEGRTRALVGERSGGLCEIALPGCYGIASNISHRKARGQGGEWAPENCMHACGSGTTGCHGFVESRWLASNRLGLRLGRREEPANVPVWMRTAEWPYAQYLLHDDGTLTPCL